MNYEQPYFRKYTPIRVYVSRCISLCDELNHQYGPSTAVIVQTKKGKDLKFFFRGDEVFTSPDWEQAATQLEAFVEYHNPFIGCDK